MQFFNYNLVQLTGRLQLSSGTLENKGVILAESASVQSVLLGKHELTEVETEFGTYPAGSILIKYDFFINGEFNLNTEDVKYV